MYTEETAFEYIYPRRGEIYEADILNLCSIIKDFLAEVA